MGTTCARIDFSPMSGVAKTGIFCCRKCIQKTQVEATQVAEVTECRRGANGHIPSDLRKEKGVALSGTPVEWFTVKQNKEEANGPKRSSK